VASEDALARDRQSEFDRRTFIKGGLALGAVTLGSTPLGSVLGAERADIVAVKGEDAFATTCKAVDALGGMARFVAKGSRVGLLVNAPTFWRLEGSHTRTDVVLAVAKMCLDAGAKELVAISALAPEFWKRSPLSEKHSAIIRSVKDSAGGTVEKKLEHGVSLRTATVAKDLFDVDGFINIPVAKHHEGCGFTGNLKNIMGALSRDTCRFFHSGSGKSGYEDVDFLSQCIADANTLRRPNLCVVDATVVLASNGPAGPGDLMRPGKVLVGTDPVAVDSYAVTLHKRRPEEIAMLAKAAAHGLGRVDFGKLTVRELSG
jgi:uncharacterized protein (DUF362 family)